tara:strand:+ start:711 stop:908 length:198 start_codon:yes stop_codon:yes gene_type:complete
VGVSAPTTSKRGIVKLLVQRYRFWRYRRMFNSMSPDEQGVAKLLGASPFDLLDDGMFYPLTRENL